MVTIMQRILKKELSSEGNELPFYLSVLENEIPTILEDLENIKERYLYDSFIHGRNHSERVYLFSYLLSKMKGLNEVDTRILLDAAIYHDIGRFVDSEDTVHGLSSAFKLENERILENPIYEDEVNRNLLYAIVAGHSRDDANKHINYEDQFYDKEVDESVYERYCILYDILKDADALDRTRFGRKSFATVDDEFLRMIDSKKLIELAYEINGIFRSEMIKGYKEHTIDPSKGGLCFHSIGFDFTKVVPILEKGVLSLSERVKMNLNVPSNFEGGNSDRWISVVDIDAIKKNAGAFSTFTKKGIGFVCDAPEMIKGFSNSERGKALELGYPYNKGDYDDERYVYEKISSDAILGVVVPEDYKEKSLRDVIYIHNAMTIEIYENSIKKYEKMLNSSGITLDRERINQLLYEYKGILRRFKLSKGIERDKLRESLPIELSHITKQISEIIGAGLEKYYMLQTGKDNVTITDALQFEISRSNVPFEIIEKGLYSLNLTSKESLENIIGRLK